MSYHVHRAISRAVVLKNGNRVTVKGRKEPENGPTDLSLGGKEMWKMVEHTSREQGSRAPS